VPSVTRRSGTHGGYADGWQSPGGDLRATAKALASTAEKGSYGLATARPTLTPVGRLLGIPNTTMFDTNGADASSDELNFSLAHTRASFPTLIPASASSARGTPPKLVRYPGLKRITTCGLRADASYAAELGVEFKAQSWQSSVTAP